VIKLWVVSASIDKGWKLEDLARESGVSARTVRYYVQRGLLPAPVFRGRDTEYSPEHLVRLRAIRVLQEQFLPLDEIQAELARRPLDELRRIADGKEAPRRAPVPAAAPAAPSHHWARWELAPGLELHLSEGADAMTRALAETIRTLAQPRRGHGGPKK
jgi:Ca-activated chloride channel family protein